MAKRSLLLHHCHVQHLHVHCNGLKYKVTATQNRQHMSLRFVEVCSGCGGLSQGFINEGFTAVLLNDNDKICCQTLKANHPNVQIECKSMIDLDLRSLKNTIDVLMGGVPCQSFSHAGKRGGLQDKRGDLILRFSELIQQVKPRVFLIENVKGLLSHDNGKTLNTVIENLDRDSEYTVSYKVLNALHYGVPQKRERVIIVGVSKEMKKPFEFPSPLSTPPKVLRDVILDCPQSEGMTYSDAKKRVLDLVPPGGCWVNLPVDVQREYMGAAFESRGGRRGMARRLCMDEPSLTLTTSPCQKQTERCHPEETRPLTIREYARIQTFPDDYVFEGTIAQKYRQIGNAVPVMLSAQIARAVKTLFE